MSIYNHDAAQTPGPPRSFGSPHDLLSFTLFLCFSATPRRSGPGYLSSRHISGTAKLSSYRQHESATVPFRIVPIEVAGIMLAVLSTIYTASITTITTTQLINNIRVSICHKFVIVPSLAGLTDHSETGVLSMIFFLHHSSFCLGADFTFVGGWRDRAERVRLGPIAKRVRGWDKSSSSFQVERLRTFPLSFCFCPTACYLTRTEGGGEHWSRTRVNLSMCGRGEVAKNRARGKRGVCLYHISGRATARWMR